MTQNYFKFFFATAMMATAITADAQVTPKVPGESPVAGKQYVLFNKAQNASQYMSRTSWDGALYFLGKAESNYAQHAVTAIKNEDGTWSFSLTTTSEYDTGDLDAEGNPVMETETSVSYMAIPYGSCNLNIKATEPAMWTLSEGDGTGFYRLTAGEGNNSNTVGMQLHLNAGGQYFVISEQPDGGQWWPDIYGGADQWEDESIGELYATPKDYISFNWAFVQPANVEAYVQDMEISGAINSFKEKYCDIDEYQAGFNATYDIVAKTYESENFDIDYDLEIIKSMMNSKIALYEEIGAAIALNEADDAVLAAAIANAKNVFDTVTDGSAVAAAVKTLKEAEVAFSMGSGDITALGANMSFEDLSSQNGSETSGVAGAPTGWNVYINGNQVVTADEVRAAGVSAWHGINSDSTGDIKDGSQSFGIWTSGVPSYEISQTIEGLENGTYVITAGLMAGSNGNGSRLTTQRIFGNLNSTYYASEYEYDLNELDNSEVYAFADNEILVTDQEMRPVSVRAYVYDGTLTFGLRTDGNIAAANRSNGNGAGGDGWFKIDNFRITKEGYVAEDAIKVLDHYRSILDIYSYDCRMEQAVKDKVEAQASQFSNISDASSQDEINAAILGAKDLLVEADVAVKAYQRLENAINLHWDYLSQYENKAGAGEYADVINEAQNGMEDCTIKTEEVDDIIAALNAALQECIQSDVIEPGMSLTEYIQNPSFEDLSAQGNNVSNGVAAPPAGWGIVIEGKECKTASEVSAASGAGWCAINNGDALNDTYNIDGEQIFNQYTDGERLWGMWGSAIPEIELSQTISHLPAGTYTLTCDIVVQNDWAGMNLGTQRIFANDYVCMYGAEEDYIQNSDEELFAQFPADILAAKQIDAENADAELKHLNYAANYSYDSYGASSCPYTTRLTFGVAQAGDVKFGFRSSRLSAADGMISGQASMGWFKLDNWTLTYDSAAVPAGAEATGIEAVGTTAVPVQFYSVSGARLSAPQKGINIVKMGNTVQKVIVK